jgi:hypothetical protein
MLLISYHITESAYISLHRIIVDIELGTPGILLVSSPLNRKREEIYFLDYFIGSGY